MRLYPLGRIVCTPVVRTYFRERVEGREHVPKTGPFVLAANHVSYIDPVVLGVACPRPIHFMAKAELFRIPVLGFLIRELGAFPVQRGAADRSAIRRALRILNDGGVVGVFPEGTRNRRGEVLNPQGGAALIALKAGVPVLPAAIWGTANIDGPLHLPKPVRVGVRFGELIDLGRPETVDRKGVDEASMRIMSKIRELQRVS
ncbi:MAG: 1-acyl-sn-glycerol-3-phosphate acyltransferase [Firmicutes bacterium]|jgi:1-acyl-sn-glycerol-3-phosphate acyltransferase|nr:1-acyl-sn-glycerol-3-phosphate acyltransferase [Bacillota bacterium]